MSSLIKKLRYWSLNRQHLLQKSTSLEHILKDVIGVYSSHPTGPLSLHARKQSFNEHEFYNLDEQRAALRITAMRLSIHIIHCSQSFRSDSSTCFGSGLAETLFTKKSIYR